MIKKKIKSLYFSKIFAIFFLFLNFFETIYGNESESITYVKFNDSKDSDNSNESKLNSIDVSDNNNKTKHSTYDLKDNNDDDTYLYYDDPFEYVNINHIKSDLNPVTGSMGGISATYEDPIGSSINFSNPAANFKLENILLTTNLNYNNRFIDSFKLKKSEIYISNLSLGFPIMNDSVFVMGYQPHTLDLINNSVINNNVYNIDKYGKKVPLKNNYVGYKGLNLFHTIYGLKMSDNWRLGLKNSFIFGPIKNEKKGSYEKKGGLSVLNSTIGSLYDIDNFSIGGTYTVENHVKNYYNSIINNDMNMITLLPNHITLGLGYGNNDKWKLNCQYSWRNSLKSEYYKIDDDDKDESLVTYYNIKKISLGGYLLSNNKNIIYRGGLYYEYVPFFVEKNNIKDNKINYGLSLGLGLKFKQPDYNSTYINIGANFGEKRNNETFFIRNRYIKIFLGVNSGIDI